MDNKENSSLANIIIILGKFYIHKYRHVKSVLKLCIFYKKCLMYMKSVRVMKKPKGKHFCALQRNANWKKSPSTLIFSIFYFKVLCCLLVAN